jgi:predicted RNA-binding protein YlqC (UPF0109 family)
MAEEYEDKQFLQYVVEHIVDYPDKVQVTRSVDEMGVLMTLDVHEDDMGKVIGRNGNTAKALRTLLRTVGMKNDARVNLKIREPEEREDNDAPSPDEDEEDSADDAMDELGA